MLKLEPQLEFENPIISKITKIHTLLKGQLIVKKIGTDRKINIKYYDSELKSPTCTVSINDINNLIATILPDRLQELEKNILKYGEYDAITHMFANNMSYSYPNFINSLGLTQMELIELFKITAIRALNEATGIRLPPIFITQINFINIIDDMIYIYELNISADDYENIIQKQMGPPNVMRMEANVKTIYYKKYLKYKEKYLNLKNKL